MLAWQPGVFIYKKGAGEGSRVRLRESFTASREVNRPWAADCGRRACSNCRADLW
jgi:ferredoxin